jgi:hypothetical protein
MDGDEDGEDDGGDEGEDDGEDGDGDGPGGYEDMDEEGDEDEAGTFTADIQQQEVPAAPLNSRRPYQYPGASTLQPTHSGAKRMSSIPHSSNDRIAVFGGSSSLTMQSPPRGAINYGSNYGARQLEDYGHSAIPRLNADRVGYYDGGSNPEMQSTSHWGINYGNLGNFAAGLSSQAYQAPQDTLLQRRRTEDAGNLTATTSTGPADFSEASYGMPGESSKKRRRT